LLAATVNSDEKLTPVNLSNENLHMNVRIKERVIAQTTAWENKVRYP